jgi:hypothetical protein
MFNPDAGRKSHCPNGLQPKKRYLLRWGGFNPATAIVGNGCDDEGALSGGSLRD